MTGSVACPKSTNVKGDSTVFYVGGQRIVEQDCDSAFVWKLNSTTTIPFTYTNWAPGEPNCDFGNEGCLNLYSVLNYQWNDGACAFRTHYICQIE